MRPSLSLRHRLARLVHSQPSSPQEVSIREPWKAARVIVASRTYATTPDDLWSALVLPDRLRRWFCPVSGDLELGGRFRIEGAASGTITECERPKKLALTWEHWGDVSWVEVQLSRESPGHTRLELTHTMLDGDHWQEHGPGAGGVGWDIALLGLAQHLAGETWSEKSFSASRDGKEFLRGAAAAWGRADVTAGREPEAARAAAERNAAFYTGSKTLALVGWLVRAAVRAISGKKPSGGGPDVRDPQRDLGQR